MYDNLQTINDVDRLRTEKQRNKDISRKPGGKENVKRKLTATNSNPNEQRSKETLRGTDAADSPNRKVPRSKPRAQSEPVVRNFTTSASSGWCRVDCYERQHHVASFQMDQAVVCVDGTNPITDKNRISFSGLPTRSEDPKVLRVKSCIGKGVQFHQDERQNLWATRLGKNPIFVRGHTLCPELVKLNGKLTQGVPMKVLDTLTFKEYMKKECEAAGKVNEELREQIMSRLKVCVSFIKDTVVDEETPCWFEVWLIKVSENVKRYLDNYQKRKDHEEKRRSGNFSVMTASRSRNKVPPMRRAKSGDALRSATHERKARSQSGINMPLTTKESDKIVPSPTETQQNCNSFDKITDITNSVTAKNSSTAIYARQKISVSDMRREKSMDVRLDQRIIMEREYRNTLEKSRAVKKESSSESPEQSLIRKGSGKFEEGSRRGARTAEDPLESSVSRVIINSPSPPETRNHQTPTAGMSYRQVFGLQSSDYLFNVTPPNYTRHRRFSDSDTESLQNFVHRIIPQDDGRSKILPNIQPKKWIKKVRRKSEDAPKRKFIMSQNK